MRLTQILFRRGFLVRKKWSGKNRIKVEPAEITKLGLMKRLAWEEENMFYLKHPYLTMEQERSGYAKALGKPLERKAALILNRQNMIPDVKIEDRLNHLKVSEKWD